MNSYLEEVYQVNGIDSDFNDINLNRDRDRKVLEGYYKSKLTDIEKNIEVITESNKEVNRLLEEDIPKLEFKINKVVEKLRGAILAERNTTSTIYSTIVPITKQYTDNNKTTARVEDSVIFGISDTKIDEDDITVLTINNISFKNLNIKKLSSNILKNLTISNLTHNTLPFEFTINLNTLVSNDSAVILDLKDYAIIEIYLNNNLYKEKSLSNYASIPVNIDTQTITIRSYPTIHKSTDLHINVLGITDLIYQESTVFETKEIGINESLSTLVLDTCDNSSDGNIKIDYYLSVNNKEYERINTVQSYSNKNTIVQSLVSLSKDSELKLLNLNGIKRSEGDIQYLLPDSVQNNVNFEIDVYLPNVNKIEKPILYLLVKEDIHLHKSVISEQDVYIDDKKINEDLFLLPKGLRKITAEAYNYSYLESIIGNENIFSSKLTKPILKKNDYKYVSLTTIDLLNAFNTTDILEIYIKDLKKEIYVSTLKLKAELISLDKKTVPYISRFLIRGI